MSVPAAMRAASVLLLLAAVPAFAQESEQSQADEEGWVQLFNGENLEGWEASEHPDNWKVEDGAIVASGPRSHLFYTKQEYKNFEFKTEVMTTPGSNSPNRLSGRKIGVSQNHACKPTAST